MITNENKKYFNTSIAIDLFTKKLFELKFQFDLIEKRLQT